MGWRDQLRPASFRGVPFEVLVAGASVGRRTAAHEFPLRDKSATEDLGLKRRSFTVQAVVIGDDVFARRDALLEACERKGAGVLIHPTFGRLVVVCEACDEVEDFLEGRTAAFSLTFAEEGDLAFPTGASSLEGVLDAAADALEAAAVADFVAAWSALGDIATAVDEVAAHVRAAKATVLGPLAAVDAVADVLDALDELAADAADLLATPADFADRVALAFGDVRDVSAYFAICGDTATFTSALPNNTDTEVATHGNAEAIQRLIWRTSLAGLAVAASAATFEAFDDAAHVRDRAAARLSAEAESGADMSRDTFDALLDLRTAVVEDLTSKSADLARVVVVELEGETSTLELAYELYGDATRASEIADRNTIVHPGFVAGAVRVLGS